MKVGFAIAELAPHAQVGGLGAVAGALPRALRHAGADVELFVPHYQALSPISTVPVGEVRVADQVVMLRRGVTSGVPVVMAHHDGWFSEGPVYRGGEADLERFAGFGLAAAASAEPLGYDVLHLNDWHTASATLATDRPTVLTIHNLAHQGIAAAGTLRALGLGDEPRNLLADGLRRATRVTTVSPRYAIEIQTPQHGEGLDPILRDRGVVGILNGIDTDEWDPSSDTRIPATYDADDMGGKSLASRALAERFGLEGEAPIAGVVSRLVHQKGLDLVPSAIERHLADARLRLAVIGTGDPAIEDGFADLARRFPAVAAYHRGFDLDLAHLVEAGSDMFLMPSRFEPCGLNQMYSLRYGTPPIVRRTGGLADTVEEWNPDTGQGTGFLFDDVEAGALSAAVDRALEVFADPGAWHQLMRNGMGVDVSWDARAPEYLSVYESVV